MEELNKYIKEAILQQKVEEINKLIPNKSFYYKLEKCKKAKNDLFSYDLKCIDKATNYIVMVRGLIDKYDVLSNLNGILEGLKLLM